MRHAQNRKITGAMKLPKGMWSPIASRLPGSTAITSIAMAEPLSVALHAVNQAGVVVTAAIARCPIWPVVEFCDRAILIDAGKVLMEDRPGRVAETYISMLQDRKSVV